LPDRLDGDAVEATVGGLLQGQTRRAAAISRPHHHHLRTIGGAHHDDRLAHHHMRGAHADVDIDRTGLGRGRHAQCADANQGCQGDFGE